MNFEFPKKSVRMGKISNNIEKHGDEEVKAFDIPIAAVLTENQLDRLAGDGTHRALYNVTKSGTEIREAFARCKPLEFTENFREASCEITHANGETLDYEDSVNISKLVLEPKDGGGTEVRYTIRVRPQKAAEIFNLLEHQYHEIKLKVWNGKLALKKDPDQKELKLDAPEQTAGDGNGEEDARAH